jgi:hypothetical protein
MDQTQAARAVLIEIMNILGVFKNELVIVGGSVPDLIYPEKKHIGSLDVDLAVGPNALASDAYSTILGRLKENKYRHSTNPARFYRAVPGVSEPVKVDLISGEYVTKEKTTAIQVNELRINALRGIDLAFEFNEEIQIQGQMPDGTQNTVKAKIVRPEAFILIKSFTLAERIKPKDAYDIAFVLHHYQPSIAVLAANLVPLLDGGLAVEAYQILRDKFDSLDSAGPSWAGDVAEENGEDREQVRQATFQDAQDLIDEVERIRK